MAGAAAPVDPTTTAAWAQLVSIAEDYTPDLRTALAADPDWVQHVTLDAADLRVDLSKNLWDDGILTTLLTLADEVGLAERRDAMFAGTHINVTEDRAVLHTALRLPPDSVADGRRPGRRGGRARGPRPGLRLRRARAVR